MYVSSPHRSTGYSRHLRLQRGNGVEMSDDPQSRREVNALIDSAFEEPKPVSGQWKVGSAHALQRRSSSKSFRHQSPDPEAILGVIANYNLVLRRLLPETLLV